MNSRKLASIQKILKLEPIIGADKIEKATILGWELLVKKGDFKENDLVVYCEIDSVMPGKPEFEFLRDRKFRIKTIKLKGQVSQGICFPISILPIRKKGYFTANSLDYKEGEDVTDIIGVKKYETPADIAEQLRENIKSNRVKKFFMKYNWFRKIFASDRMCFPAFIKKTDEERIQLFPNICEKEKDTLFEITEKLDGQSATYFLIRNTKKWQFWKPYIFGVCSRNFLKGKPDNSTWWRIAIQYDIEKKLKKIISNDESYIVIQGEIIGEKIQDNKYKIKGLDFYVFNVFSSSQNNCLFLKELISCNMGIRTVPIIYTDSNLKSSIPAMVEFSKGKSILADIPREGIVYRNYEKGISFKVINSDFLLKYGE